MKKIFKIINILILFSMIILLFTCSSFSEESTLTPSNAGGSLISILDTGGTFKGKRIMKGTLNGEEFEYVEGEIIVKFKDTVPTNTITSKHQLNSAQILKVSDYNPKTQLIEKTGNENLFDVIKNYNDDPNIEFAEPNYIVTGNSTQPMTPSDLLWEYQWGPKKIEADLAWNISEGSENIIIAIIDSGIDYNHPDLIGQVDISKMVDLVDNDNNAMDKEGHGTSCAGIAAARTNNAIGIAGIAPKCTLRAVRVLDENGHGTTWDCSIGILLAADSGCQILSMSFGGKSKSSLLEGAVEDAHDKGCILVASAGNSNNSKRKYPAGYGEVIAVAATTAGDIKASFSNYGSWIDVAAPGVNTLSTALDNGYTEFGGTSGAAPHVSALAALILSINPGLSPGEVEQIIKSTADNIDALNPDYIGRLGTGRINAYRALMTIGSPIVDNPPNVPILLSPQDGHIIESGQNNSQHNISFIASYFDPDGDSGHINFQVATDASFNNIVANVNSAVVPNNNNGSQDRVFGFGIYYWRARAVDSDGLVSGWSTSRTIAVLLDGGATDNYPPNIPALISPQDETTVTPGSTVSLTASYSDINGDNGKILFKLLKAERSILSFKMVDGQLVPLYFYWCTTVDQYESETLTNRSYATWTPDIPLTNERYIWSAKAVDSNGSESGKSNARWVFVAEPGMTISKFNMASTPDIPVPVSPANGANTTILNPTLTATYTDLDGDSGTVNFQIATDIAFNNIVAGGFSGVVASGSNASWTSTVLNPGTYYWRSQTQDIGGSTSGWSSYSEISIEMANDYPYEPVILSPENNLNTSDSDVTFTAFYSDPNEDQGRICFRIAKDQFFFNVVATGYTDYLANNTNGSWTATALSPGTYYCIAYSIDTNNLSSTWSTSRIISITTPVTITNNPPNVSALISPVHAVSTTENTPTFIAEYIDPDGDNGQVYFCIAKDIECNNIVQYGNSILLTSGSHGSWTASELSCGTYYWRVYSQDSNGLISPWSGARTINIVAPAVLIPNSIRVFPNPFNPITQSTTINFNVDDNNSSIDIYLYNMNAQLIWKESYHYATSGQKQETWEGKTAKGDFASDGIYLFRVVESRSKELIAKGKIWVIKR